MSLQPIQFFQSAVSRLALMEEDPKQPKQPKLTFRVIRDDS
jgi:hypothetical protein